MGRENMILLLFLVFVFMVFKLLLLSYQHRQGIGAMGGMVLAMSLAMVTGLFTGEAVFLFSNNMALATLLGILSGSGLGVMAALPFGILALLDALLSGAMGGLMGAMLGMVPVADRFLFPVMWGIEFLALFLLFLFFKQRLRVLRVKSRNRYWLRRLVWYWKKARLFR